MYGFIAHDAFVADLDPDRVEKDQGVGRIQGALLPGRNFLQNRISHGADQIGRGFDAIELAQMPNDLPGAHPPRIHRDDLVVEARETAPILGDQLRIKTARPVARHLDLDPSRLGRHRLAAITVPAVVALRFLLEMMVHLGVECPFRQRFLQRVQQAALVQRRRSVSACQQLIEKLLRYRRFFPS